MARWLTLAMTLICFGSCSVTSTSTFRGIVAPIGVVIFSLLSLYLFIHAKLAITARPPVTATLDPEVQMLMRKRAAERKAEQERMQTQPQPPATGGRRTEPGA